MIPAHLYRCLKLTGLALLALSYLTECSGKIQEFYMTDFCSSSVNLQVSGSLMLHFTQKASLPQKRSDDGILLLCQLSISAMDRSNRLLLHIVKLHIDLKHVDRLHVYEVSGDTIHRLSPAEGLYGKYGGNVQISSDGISDYKTARDTFYLDYKGIPTKEYDGFTILFTEFHDIPSYAGSCIGSFFECTVAKICISSTLTCNSYRNCGEYDNSDEVSCSPQGLPSDSKDGTHDSTIPIALSVGIVATLTFLLVSLAIFLVTRLRRRQMVSGRRETGSITGSLTRGGESGTQESGSNLATLYAPPSYEDVMSSNPSLSRENPPPYDSLVSLHIEEITLPRATRATTRIQDTSLTSLPTTPTSRATNSLILSSRGRHKDDDTSENNVSSQLSNSDSSSSLGDRTNASQGSEGLES